MQDLARSCEIPASRRRSRFPVCDTERSDGRDLARQIGIKKRIERARSFCRAVVNKIPFTAELNAAAGYGTRGKGRSEASYCVRRAKALRAPLSETVPCRLGVLANQKSYTC